MPTLAVNGAELYHEVRGDGPPLLLIMGMTGDAGHFEGFADLLADEFTVVTYDRRGNGRSPRPSGWTSTSPEEQADDAAALLDSLGLAPAAVYGSSSGGTFALCLEGMEAGGPPAVLERLWRYVAGDAGWERLEPGLRGRMQASADTLLDVELGSYESFLPDEETLASVAAPVLVLVSEQGPSVYGQAAGRMAERLGVEVTCTPGTHTAYHDRPHELAETIRQFLREVSS